MDELTRFVRDALSRQVPRGEVETVLLQAGWRPEQVRKALGAYSDTPFPVPVRSQSRMSPRGRLSYISFYFRPLELAPARS